MKQPSSRVSFVNHTLHPSWVPLQLTCPFLSKGTRVLEPYLVSLVCYIKAHHFAFQTRAAYILFLTRASFLESSFAYISACISWVHARAFHCRIYCELGLLNKLSQRAEPNMRCPLDSNESRFCTALSNSPRTPYKISDNHFGHRKLQ